MKKIFVSALFVSFLATVQAQEIPHRDRDHGRPDHMMRKKHHRGMEFKALNLTEEQKTKFQSVAEKFRNQMSELKKNENITVKEWKAKAENIRKEHKENMKSILTDAQKEQLEKMKKEGNEKREDMQKRMSERMKTELGLSADQSAKLESNRKLIQEKMKAIHEDKSMGIAEKKQQMMEVHKMQREFMKTLLTEEQMQKIKNHRPGPHREGMRHRPESKKVI